MKYIFYLTFCIFFIACESEVKLQEVKSITHTITSTEGSSIKQKIRNEIAKLNELAIESIITNNKEILDSIKSINLYKRGTNDLKEALQFMHSQMITEPQSVFIECWTKRSHENIEHHIKNKVEKGEIIDSIFYDIKYTSPPKEVYLSILRMKSKFCERLVCFIYGKYDSNWKLDYMAVGNFKIKGLTAPELIKQAKTYRNEGHLTQALTSVFASQSCASPVYSILQFRKESKNTQLSEEIINEFSQKYPFPIEITVKGVSGEIIGLTMKSLDSGEYLPYISYITDTPLTEREKILSENSKIHSRIEEFLPSIKVDFSGIIYGIYNDNPELIKGAKPYSLLKKNNS